MEPVLSVIIPNRNHGHYLAGALEAIFSQSLAPDEVLVVDDSSTDDSLAVLADLSLRYDKLKVFTNSSRLGVERSLNRLLQLSGGEYVHCAAVDDLVMPGFYEKSIALLKRHPTAGVCNSMTVYIDEHSHILGHPALPVPCKEPVFLPPAIALRWLTKYGVWFSGCSSIYKREDLMAVGGFRPELEVFADNYAIQEISLRSGACFLPEPLTAFRRLQGSYSAQCFRDIPHSLELLNRMGQKMANASSGVFPPDYISRFIKEMRFSLLMNMDRRCPRWEKMEVDQSSLLLGTTSRSDAVVVRLRNFWPRAAKPLTWVWGRARLGLLAELATVSRLARRILSRKRWRRLLGSAIRRIF